MSSPRQSDAPSQSQGSEETLPRANTQQPVNTDGLWAAEEDTLRMQQRRRLTDEEILHCFDEFLYHGELRDVIKAQHSFERISSSLGTEDFDALIPPCLEVLEFSNQYIRNDTLLCLMYISLGCTRCDLPGAEVVSAMRRNAAVLARHDSLPMFVRSLDFLLGVDTDRMPVDEGVLEREFRLIFNCIYIQLLFNEHDDDFVHSLELGQGRLGSSLVALLFEATKMSAENDRIPIKKVILLLLRVLQCLLRVPDHILYPMPAPVNESQQSEMVVDDTNESTKLTKRPRLREFQAFTALVLHDRSVRQKYNSSGFPAAIQEGLKIIESYLDEFMVTYSFHPSEISFMQNTLFLHDTYQRYEELRSRGLTVPEKPATKSAPKLPNASQREEGGVESWAAKAFPTALGTLDGPIEHTQDAVSVSGSEDRSDGVSDVGSDISAQSEGGTSVSSNTTAIDLRKEDATRAPLHVKRATSDPFTAHGESMGNASFDLHDHSPTATFERLYLQIFVLLTETVVLLLRLLLTSCSNVENYPGVIDMARERHACSIVDEQHGPERIWFAAVEKAMPDDAVEAQRHREIMAAAVSGVILILLKQARQSAAEQFSSLSQLITDSNGALVVLKFLNQDLSAAMEPRDSHPVLPCLRGMQLSDQTWIPSWPACATLRLVEVLYLLCKDSPERVRKFLIHYKAPFILKRLHRIDNQQVQRLVLKLLKKQVRYLPRKWKQANMKAISAIYTLVPMSPLEDWLLNEPLGGPSTEGPSQADIRASNVVYNAALMQHLSGGRNAGGAQQHEGTSADNVSSAMDAAWESQLPKASSHGSSLSLSQVAALALSSGDAGLAKGSGMSRDWDDVDLLFDEVVHGSHGYADMFPEFVPVALP